MCDDVLSVRLYAKTVDSLSRQSLYAIYVLVHAFAKNVRSCVCWRNANNYRHRRTHQSQMKYVYKNYVIQSCDHWSIRRLFASVKKCFVPITVNMKHGTLETAKTVAGTHSSKIWQAKRSGFLIQVDHTVANIDEIVLRIYF